MGKEINRVVYIRRINAIIVPFSFKTLHKVADGQALIDCGASENFIDIDTWKELKIGRFRLRKPITVYNVQCQTAKIDKFASAQSRFFQGNWTPEL